MNNDNDLKVVNCTSSMPGALPPDRLCLVDAKDLGHLVLNARMAITNPSGNYAARFETFAERLLERLKHGVEIKGNAIDLLYRTYSFLKSLDEQEHPGSLYEDIGRFLESMKDES